MIPLIPVLIAGAAAITGMIVAKRWRSEGDKSKNALVRRTDSDPKTRLSREAPKIRSFSVRAALKRLDNRWQTFMQTRFDPLIAGRAREAQLNELTRRSGLRELSPQEQSVNRSLLVGGISLALLGVAAVTGSWPLALTVLVLGLYNGRTWLRETWRVTTQERRFSLMHLLLLYFMVMWLGGYFLVGVFTRIFSDLCEKIEHLARTVARHSLSDLLGEQPQRVWVLVDGVEIEIPFEQLHSGDILVLDAGQSIPIDGIVVEGMARVDQHRLTGESEPVEKAVGDPVLAATLVLGGRIRVRVEKTGAETAAARIGEILTLTVEDHEIRLADLFRSLERTRLPMLAGSAFGFVLGGPTTAVAMLGCNCMLSLVPLRLLTLMNGLKAGTERGILVKDGRALERLPKIDTVVFDKTGTLTLDRPRVVRVHACWARDENQVLRLAAAAEHRQTHPIARAILAAATERQLDIPVIDEAHYEIGFGLTVKLAGRKIRVGSLRFLEMAGLALTGSLRKALEESREHGHSLIFVADGKRVIGAIELAATVRPEARAIIDWLERCGLERYILSGDHEAPTRQLAADLAMTGYFADTLPEQKAERVKELQAQGRRVCFIGDGINDAIALRQAEVSVSLRGATTVATDAAQVVLMDDDLSQLRVLWELARGYEYRIDANSDQAREFSFLAAVGVLGLPYKFWTVTLLWSVQVILGIQIATRPLIGSVPEIERVAAPLEETP
ncbi:MAG: heavy metal translocating P-type ATPase [Methylococcales bacterium]